MPALRFVHAADLHLDSPFQGLRNNAPADVAAALREATFDAYDRIIDLCIEQEVHGLLIAGDVYDGADRSLSAQLRFVEGLNRLDRAGIQSFVCHGNHDPLDGWTARLAFPESCHRFGERVTTAALGSDGRATVYGISYPTRNVTEDLTPHFQRRPGDGFAIGLLHANVDSASGHESYAPCTLDALRQTGIDYWALGHVHTRAILSPGNPAVVYPGNPQGRHSGETGPRGVCLVEVDGSNRVGIDFVPVCSVRWEAAEVDISTLDSEQALLDALVATAEGLLHETGDCSVVSRFTLTGRGPLHATLRREGTLETLREHLNHDLNRRTPFLWCERLTDRTAPDFDREARRQVDDFLGDVLRMIGGLEEDPVELAALMETATNPLFNHPRARAWLAGYTPDSARVLADAERRILDLLLERQ